jgi:CheY-like chemotaxis protein
VSIQKIMIVEDDEDIRDICAMSARKIGKWDVVIAASGEEALVMSAIEEPDVILLDVMMPGMDGITTLAKLREQELTSHLPVIFFTARVQEHELRHYLALGAAGVIQKPFDPMTLPDEIRRIVDRSMSGRRDKGVEESDAGPGDLRESFRRRLPQRLEELATALREAHRTQACEAEIRRASAVAHQLRGTAGSYGFHGISTEVGLIEEKLSCLPDPGGSNPEDLWVDIEDALVRAQSLLGTRP